MFKKRTQSKKQANIDDILTEIGQQEQPSQPAQPPARVRQIGNEQNIEGGAIGKSSGGRRGKGVEFGYEEERVGEIGDGLGVGDRREFSGSQIEQCFAEFVRQQKQNEKLEQQQNITTPYYGSQQPYEPFLHGPPAEPEPQPLKQKPVLYQVIVEDESGQHLQVHEDYGQISPDLSDSEQYEQGYENEIIRKTLSKVNYDQVAKSLSSAHRQCKQKKLLKELGKVTYSGVQRKIARDLRLKKEKRNQLMNEVKYIESKIKQRHGEIAEKMKSRDRMEGDLDKVKRIIEILYYFGNSIEIDGIDETSLGQMVYEEEWKQRIDRIRATLHRNKTQFDKKIKKQEDAGSQKAKSEGSQGDVELIGKGKGKEGWDDWHMDEDDEERERGVIRLDDDADGDQCIEIDDD